MIMNESKRGKYSSDSKYLQWKIVEIHKRIQKADRVSKIANKSIFEMAPNNVWIKYEKIKNLNYIFKKPFENNPLFLNYNFHP